MTVFLWAQKLTYISVPKVACTSLKHMFFEIENGHPYEPVQINGNIFHIHRFYGGYAFDDLPRARIADHSRLTLVRDPLRRLLSCYSNRVVHHKELSPEKAGPALRKAGLKPNPSLALFVDRLEEYAETVGPIGHHARPMVNTIGRDPGYFEAIYSLERIGEFVQRVERQVGRSLTLTHRQTSGPKIDPNELSPGQVAAIRKYYAEDYDIWGGYF